MKQFHVFDKNETTNQNQISIIQDINTNDINLLWIIPQFFLITISEVMVSIPSLKFAYTQAPTALKSIQTAFVLLAVSIGNIIVIIVAEGKILPTQVGEYLLFAGLVVAAAIIYFLIAVFYYDYVDENEFDGFEYPMIKKEEQDLVQKENMAFENDL